MNTRVFCVAEAAGNISQYFSNGFFAKYAFRHLRKIQSMETKHNDFFAQYKYKLYFAA